MPPDHPEPHVDTWEKPPWYRERNDFVMVLDTRGPLATKRHVREPGGQWRTESYGRAQRFHIWPASLQDIRHLAERVGGDFAFDPRRLVVRGEWMPESGIN